MIKYCKLKRWILMTLAIHTDLMAHHQLVKALMYPVKHLSFRHSCSQQGESYWSLFLSSGSKFQVVQYVDSCGQLWTTDTLRCKLQLWVCACRHAPHMLTRKRDADLMAAGRDPLFVRFIWLTNKRKSKRTIACTTSGWRMKEGSAGQWSQRWALSILHFPFLFQYSLREMLLWL